MKKYISINNKKIEYVLTYKNVKNVNFRVKPDGKIYVSANKRVSETVVKELIMENQDFFLKALKKYSDIKEPERYFTEEELKDVVLKLCKSAYGYFEDKGVLYPKIKFRKMTSRWGSCNVAKNTLTFNTNLVFAPLKCVEYVVYHEFTHFIVQNHSRKFYEELQKVFPMWKECRNELKNIVLL